MADRIAAVVGATGLVGRSLVEELLADYAFERVIVPARRPFEHASHARLESRVIDFERLANEKIDATDAFCALGTTMRQAKSKDAFRRVDHDYVLAFANAVRPRAERFALVSSIGADAKSMFFYNRVKGETEAETAALGFTSCGLFRPSVLVGERSESRPGEKIGTVLLRGVGALPFTATRRLRPIDARDVARAMVAWSKRDAAGVSVIESEEIRAMARSS